MTQINVDVQEVAKTSYNAFCFATDFDQQL